MYWKKALKLSIHRNPYNWTNEKLSYIYIYIPYTRPLPIRVRGDWDLVSFCSTCAHWISTRSSRAAVTNAKHSRTHLHFYGSISNPLESLLTHFWRVMQASLTCNYLTRFWLVARWLRNTSSLRSANKKTLSETIVSHSCWSIIKHRSCMHCSCPPSKQHKLQALLLRSDQTRTLHALLLCIDQTPKLTAFLMRTHQTTTLPLSTYQAPELHVLLLRSDEHSSRTKLSSTAAALSSGNKN